jgi:hypothetical protein
VRRYCVGNLCRKESEEMVEDVKKPPDEAENDVTYDPPDFRGLDDRRDDDADADDDRGDLTHLIGM